jgi:Protein of unknown function (DUF2892)
LTVAEAGARCRTRFDDHRTAPFRKTAMTPNVGSIDRILRLVVGLLIAGLGYTMLAGVWALAAVGIGAVMALTALVGFCPAYTILGINTCRRRLPGA